MTTNRSRNQRFGNVGMFPYGISEYHGVHETAMIERAPARVASERNPSKNSFCGAWSESRQARKASIARRLLQLIQIFDTKLAVNEPDLRHAKPGDARHLHETVRDALSETVEIARLAGFDQLLKYREGGWSDIGCLLELTGLEERCEIVDAKGED
jgi:hypothetical protein